MMLGYNYLLQKEKSNSFYPTGQDSCSCAKKIFEFLIIKPHQQDNSLLLRVTTVIMAHRIMVYSRKDEHLMDMGIRLAYAYFCYRYEYFWFPKDFDPELQIKILEPTSNY